MILHLHCCVCMCVCILQCACVCGVHVCVSCRCGQGDRHILVFYPNTFVSSSSPDGTDVFLRVTFHIEFYKRPAIVLDPN